MIKMNKLTEKEKAKLTRLLINLDSLKDEFQELADDIRLSEDYDSESQFNANDDMEELVNDLDALVYDYEKLFGLDLYGGD